MKTAVAGLEPGEVAGAGNIIAFNALNGVNVVNGTTNAVVRNSIHSNTLLGINLGTAGVTVNDSGDGDGGANNLQLYDGNYLNYKNDPSVQDLSRSDIMKDVTKTVLKSSG